MKDQPNSPNQGQPQNQQPSQPPNPESPPFRKGSGDFVRDLGWSVSTSKMFKACPRAVALKTLEAWEGWDNKAPENKRLAYRLSKLTPFQGYAGKVVHAAIAGHIQQASHFPHMAGGLSMPGNLEDFQEKAVQALRDAWTASELGTWFSQPKAPRFFEHHYNREIRDPKGVAQKVRDCLYWFARMPEYRILFQGKSLAIEELQSLVLGDGQKVWIQMDYAQAVDGRIHIWDWKSGKPSDDDFIQRDIYTLAATRLYGVEPDQVFVHLMYLKPQQIAGGRGDKAQIEAALETIHEDTNRAEWLMLKDMADGRDKDDLECFAKQIEGPGCRACRDCIFREYCWKRRD